MQAASTNHNMYQNTLKVMLNGNYYFALIDTGATCSIINKTLTEYLPKCSYKKLQKPSTSILGIGNQTQTILDNIEMDIIIGKHKFRHTFYVIDNSFSIILGMDFLNKYHATLDFSKNLVSIGGFFHKLEVLPTRSTAIRLLGEQIIPPNSSQYVRIKMNKPITTGYMIIKQTQSFIDKFSGLSVTPGIIDN